MFAKHSAAQQLPFMLMQAKFIERSQALLHGDMHTGSLMVTQDTTYAIDAEFAVYGPIAFDVGKFMANLLLAFFALDGHSTAADTRSKQRGWLYQVAACLLSMTQCMTQQKQQGFSRCKQSVHL